MLYIVVYFYYKYSISWYLKYAPH